MSLPVRIPPLVFVYASKRLGALAKRRFCSQYESAMLRGASACGGASARFSGAAPPPSGGKSAWFGASVVAPVADGARGAPAAGRIPIAQSGRGGSGCLPVVLALVVLVNVFRLPFELELCAAASEPPNNASDERGGRTAVDAVSSAGVRAPELQLLPPVLLRPPPPSRGPTSPGAPRFLGGVNCRGAGGVWGP